MPTLQRLRNRVMRALHDPTLPVYYSAHYRLPIASLESSMGIEPRRADLAAWALVEQGVIRPGQLQVPPRVRYRDLFRVHTAEYLESLTRPEPLAQVFAAPPGEVVVDEVLHTVRLAVGATVAGARLALQRKGPVLNLLGGFHHAFPAKGAGMCAVNDLAVAIAALREEGLKGQVAIIDLDAHPPDGTAACLEGQTEVWLGSISGVDWGPLPAAVDEVVLPQAVDATYLHALDGLLARMPRPVLAFVVAGGDVLAGDRLGCLALTMAGVRRRDLVVARALHGIPSLWVPGGGYREDAWHVLAGTGMALALGSRVAIPARVDPLSLRFAEVSQALDPQRLRGVGSAEGDDEAWITEADLADVLGMPGRGAVRLLGYYSAQGIEYALYRFGLLEQVRRLGYEDLRVVVDRVALGDRMRLLGRADGQEHLLVEGVYARHRVQPPRGATSEVLPRVLFVHWLTLRHPRGTWSAERPQLPGQDAPGLGMAREAGEMLARMAERLELAGVALRPAWYHVAFACRSRFRFVDPARQGRYEALLDALSTLPLLDATKAVAEGRVLLDGQPYTWEPDLMVAWRQEPPWAEDRAAVLAARQAAHFEVVVGEAGG